MLLFKSMQETSRLLDLHLHHTVIYGRAHAADPAVTISFPLLGDSDATAECVSRGPRVVVLSVEGLNQLRSERHVDEMTT